METINAWSLNEQTYFVISSGSSIAAASSYLSVSTRLRTWIEVLSVSRKGIEVNTWSRAIKNWLEEHINPSVMVKPTTNDELYEYVTVTAVGDTFGEVRQDGQANVIENWKVADNMLDWSLIGDVIWFVLKDER